MRRMAKDPLSVAGASLTPQEIAILRKEMANIVSDYLPEARLVLSGAKRWSNIQVKLFAMLTNKVVPDLHHSYTQIGVERKSLNELSREELEQIAATGVAGRTIEIEPPHIPPPLEQDPAEARLLAMELPKETDPANRESTTAARAERAKKFRTERNIIQRATRKAATKQ
jgi:hypothetical protein